jgi:hypothetical protein
VASCPLRASYAAVASAREFVRHVLADWGSEADQVDLSPNLSDDVSLVASEMVANALQHGVGLDPPQDAVPASDQRAGAEPDEQVGLTLVATPSVLLCVVNDPSSDAPVPRLPDPGMASGRGLHLIESLSESWGWSPVADDGVHAARPCGPQSPASRDAPRVTAAGPPAARGTARRAGIDIGRPHPPLRFIGRIETEVLGNALGSRRQAAPGGPRRAEHGRGVRDDVAGP